MTSLQYCNFSLYKRKNSPEFSVIAVTSIENEVILGNFVFSNDNRGCA